MNHFLETWFSVIANSVLEKSKSPIPSLFNIPEVLSSASDKAKLFAKNSNLEDSSTLWCLIDVPPPARTFLFQPLSPGYKILGEIQSNTSFQDIYSFFINKNQKSIKFRGIPPPHLFQPSPAN